MENIRKILASLCIILSCVANGITQNQAKTIDKAGAWCWFSDPRAIYLHGEKPGVLTGWVKADGTIEAALIDPKTKAVQTETLYDQLEIDDHDNPAFLQLPNGNYMAFYAKHVKKYLYYHHSSPIEDRLFQEVVPYDPISKEELKTYPRGGVTYTNPFVLTEENNRIYVFGRWTGFKPNIMWSDDNGKTFSKGKVFIAEEGFDPGNRPYLKYSSDGRSKIHIVFTDGHPRNEPTNSVYYTYYENGAFWRADGSQVCTIDQIPFKPTEATLVYKANKETGRAWVYDVHMDKKGDPTILYARYPTEEEHLYHYAKYDGKKWHDHHIVNSGKWFPQTKNGKKEREPHYSAGLVLHPLNPNVVYLSREVNGVFEIEKWTAKKNGEKWKSEPITQNSTFDNVRPYVPRNMKKGDPTMILWMENEKYIHYTDYQSNIKFLVE